MNDTHWSAAQEREERIREAGEEMLAALKEARAALDNPEIFTRHPVGLAREMIHSAIEAAEGRS